MESLKLIANAFKSQPFSLKNAEELGLTRYELKKLLAQGKVKKLAHGIYALSKGDISLAEQFRNAAALIGQPSVICLLSALEYYDITDVISKEIWVMVPATRRTHKCGIRLFRTAHFNQDIGIVKTKDFSITSIERTIVDALTHQRQVAITV
ncbi:MAG TPA: type IV toxin-antitoxin system AbiEi family antitoxin domain-containing protein, partial [Myxococcota bacterium]|nr:type IV toxin-antitoxin system AbiEi family antitoxin domain-containing protein [Myxococcota bacterium]